MYKYFHTLSKDINAKHSLKLFQIHIFKLCVYHLLVTFCKYMAPHTTPYHDIQAEMTLNRYIISRFNEMFNLS